MKLIKKQFSKEKQISSIRSCAHVECKVDRPDGKIQPKSRSFFVRKPEVGKSLFEKKVPSEFYFRHVSCSLVNPAKNINTKDTKLFAEVLETAEKKTQFVKNKIFSSNVSSCLLNAASTRLLKNASQGWTFLPNVQKSKKKRENPFQEKNFVKQFMWTRRLPFWQPCLKKIRRMFEHFPLNFLKGLTFRQKEVFYLKMVIWALEILFWLTCRIIPLNVPELFWLKSENDKKNFYQFFCSSQWSYGHIQNNSGILANFFPESPKKFP